MTGKITLEYVLSLAVIFGLALAASLLLGWAARPLAPRLGMLSVPGGRRKEPTPIAKLGALPLWGAFLVAALVSQAMPVERGDPNEVIRLAGLLLGGTFIFLAGLADDRFNLPALPQFISQFIASGIAILCLIFIERFNNPLTGETTAPWPYVVTAAISLFWLTLMMNTVNFLDGTDGLAGGVIFIAALLLFVHTAREGQLSVSLLPMALMGAVLGFLVFNWHPARLIMGSGATTMGFTLGALSIIGGAKMATILLVMGLPLLDLVWQFARRLREGKNPFVGDRGHIHFRLIDAGWSPPRLALVYFLFCLAFGLLALVTTSRLFKLVGLIVLIGLTLAGFALVERLSGKLPAEPEAKE